jgi:SAM-dependent methyltransferase
VSNLSYTGERLVSNNKILEPMRVENLARYNFFAQRFAGEKVLDLGCGDGEGSGFLRNINTWCVYSVDIADDALRFAKKTYGQIGIGYFIRADIRHLAFKSNIFDGIISVEVIEHIEDPERYFCEASRILKGGGILILTTPNRLLTAPPNTCGSLWPAHVREYTPSELFSMASRYFSWVELLGEQVPIYENNIWRRVMRKFAPLFKNILPPSIRIRALPTLQFMIKPKLEIRDIEFSSKDIEEKPTLVAVCRK